MKQRLKVKLLFNDSSFLLYTVDQIIKGLVHPQNENYVINYSPSCRSKPVRPSFIFRTQIKIFMMKCESFLTLHRPQHNCNVPRSRNVARNGGRHNSGEKNCWKHLYVFCAQKLYSRSFAKLKLSHWCHMDCFTDVLATFLDLGILQLCCYLWRVRELSHFIINILICVLKMNEGLMGLERQAGE